MYQGLIHLHSLLRWIIIILLVWNIVRHFTAGKNPFNSTDKKLALYLMISAHITLLLGLYQWFTGSFGLEIIRSVGMGAAMKDSTLRFWAVEHITGMLIAIVLITLGKAVARKNLSDEKKHTRMAVMFLLALLIILAVVPWPFRTGAIGRPWFPGM
jgi:cation transport ATPase